MSVYLFILFSKSKDLLLLFWRHRSTLRIFIFVFSYYPVDVTVRSSISFLLIRFQLSFLQNFNVFQDLRLAVARQPCWVVSVLKSVYWLKNNLQFVLSEVLFVKVTSQYWINDGNYGKHELGHRALGKFFDLKLIICFHKNVQIIWIILPKLM